MIETVVGIISFIGGFFIKDYFKFRIFKRKKDYNYELKIMQEANKSMKKLLTKMSIAKNSINEFYKDNSNRNKFKKAKNDISDCINYFEKNRAELFMYIAKEESPIFIDYAVVLRNTLESCFGDKKKVSKLVKTLENFQKLYDNYYNQFELFSKKPKI